MNSPKDYFSKQSDLYAKFRPTYPKGLFDWLLSLVKEQNRAWDCGTGNGQVAVEIAPYFDQVFATDISSKQLEKAPPVTNVQYRVSSAENTKFEDGCFDLITVAQAIHWFDHEAFNKEVKRVLKPSGILAVWGYGLLKIAPEIDVLVEHYYKNIIGPYWAAERKYIDEHYQNIPFPFSLISPPEEFSIKTTWSIEEMEGYLNTWSSLQTYLATHKENPVPKLIQQIKKTGRWEDGMSIRFPIFMKVGRY